MAADSANLNLNVRSDQEEYFGSEIEDNSNLLALYRRDNSTAASGDYLATEITFSNIATGLGLYLLSFLTFVGNAMVLHAIR